MRDDPPTRIVRREPPSFAYMFWTGGPRRGSHVALRDAGTTFGRGETADVQMNDETVSDEHIRIRKDKDGWYAYDLASTNTLQVAGETTFRRKLANGDSLIVGQTELIFRVLE